MPQNKQERKEFSLRDLLTISYRSRGKLSDPAQDIFPILAESLSNNKARDITGILLFDGRFFMQTIEGPTTETNDLFESIAKDVRHKNVEAFGIENIQERDFPDWHMELLERDETARIIPDLKKFKFSYRRLREVQAMAAGLAKRKHAKPSHH
ncbi:BLUF domain-containing protein [Roseovarius tibetensis]|uniref:BLUF domain-containing protein n=1 Tax=Roseovarius tibetensis TaxID=2685897 RepID=UPI003D7FBF33